MAPTNREITFILRMRNAAKAAIREFGGDLKSVAAQGKAASEALKGLNEQTRNANPSKPFKQGAKDVATFSSTVKGAVAALTGLSGALLTVQGVQAFANLERQLSVFKAVTQASEADMARVKAAAREMGATTEFSASQGAEALINYARAGFTVEQAMAAAKSSLNFALVAGIDLGEAAATTGSIMNQFAVSAERAADVVDVLAKVDNISAASAASLGESFKYAGTVANAAGVSFNTLAAAMGVVGDAGTLGSMAGTQLQQVISRMLKPTPEAAQALKEMGLSIKDLDAKDLVGTFTRLHDASMTAGQGLRIFGEEGGRAAILLSSSPEKLRKYEEATRKAGGTAAEAARIIGDNLTGDFRQLQSAGEELANALGDAGVGGALRIMTQTLTDGVNGIAGFVRQIKDGSAEAKVLTAALAGIGTAAGVAVLVGGFAALTTAIRTSSIAMAAFNAVTKLNPLLLIAGAIVTAITLLYEFRDATFKWGNDTVRVGDLVMAIWDKMKAEWSAFTKYVSDTTSGFMQGWGEYYSTVASIFGQVVEAGTKAATALVNVFIAFYVSVKDVFVALGNTVYEVFMGMVENGKQLFSNLADGIKGAMTLDFDGMREAFNRPTKDLTKVVADNFAEVKAKIAENFSTDYVKAFVDSASRLIEDLKSGAIKTLDEVTQRAKQIEDDRKKAEAAAKNGQTQFDNPNKPGTNDASQVRKFAEALTERIQKLKDEAATIGLGARARDRLTAQLETERDARKAGITDTKQYVDAYLKEYDALQRLKDAYQSNPVNGIRAGFDDFIEDNLKLADKVKDAWNTALNGIADNLADLIVDGNASFADMVKSFAKQMLSAGFKNILANAFKGLGIDKIFGGSQAAAGAITTATATITANSVVVNGTVAGTAPLGAVQRGAAGSPLSTGSSGIGSDYVATLRAGASQAKNAFLDAIASVESGGRYDIRYGGVGSPGKTFDPSAGHPNILEPTKDGRFSSAAGAYQITGSTYRDFGGGGFMPEDQRNMAWRIAEQRSGLGSGLESYLQQNGFDRNLIGKLGGTWEGLKVDPSKAMATYNQSIGGNGQQVVQQAQQAAQQVSQIQTQSMQRQVQTVQQTAQQLESIQVNGSAQQAANANQLNQQLAAAQASGDAQKIAAAQQAAQQYIQLNQAVAGAGNSAANAAPQFQQVQARTTTATPQVGNFGQGVGALLGPLSSVVPGLGQFSGVIMSVINALGSSGGGGLGGGGGFFSALFGIGHSGAKIGSYTSGYKAVALSAFANAPRYHTGGKLGPDEVPFIGLKGERVLNREETRAYEAGQVSGGLSSTKHGSTGGKSGVHIGDISIPISIQTQGSSGDRQKDEEHQRNMSRQVGAAVDQHMTEWFINQSRPGGLLAR
ncbi:phage tail tape measure protein (plasmid) [Rhizobium bangladeshense]|uniref:phage tail tape measure protein n=1 Tax=Rhizobium bangladeshense TaxID=1138189 RepID=UPI001A99AC9B|nr:phage tail tape measure protein [Rhizobium bangladeshense]QSY98656.1 phage tail tape measure protein [Rhizobium bangladeshense]